MVDHTLNFGIAGAGVAARYHAEAILRTPGARLVAVCRGQPGATEEAAARFGVPCAPDYNALLAHPAIDAVCICTPSGQHAAQTIAAARHGKHVLVEKPMALTLPDAHAMIEACREAGVTLSVALQRRALAPFTTVRAAVEAGALGRLVFGSVIVPYLRTQSYYDSANWRGTWALDGGGALMNQGIHLIDLLLWYMGDVADVQAHAATLAHPIEVEDTLTATVRFSSGALASIAATTAAAPGFPHQVAIYGDRGGVQIEGERVARWQTLDGATPAIDNAQAADAGAGASPTGISAEGHTALMHDFVAAVREGRAPLVPGEEGLRSLDLVLRMYEAAGIRG